MSIGRPRHGVAKGSDDRIDRGGVGVGQVSPPFGGVGSGTSSQGRVA